MRRFIRWQRQLLCMKASFHAEKSLMGESIKMNTNDIVRYSLQLAMLLKLYDHKLLSWEEYVELKQRLEKDYRICTNLTI